MVRALKILISKLRYAFGDFILCYFLFERQYRGCLNVVQSQVNEHPFMLPFYLQLNMDRERLHKKWKRRRITLIRIISIETTHYLNMLQRQQRRYKLKEIAPGIRVPEPSEEYAPVFERLKRIAKERMMRERLEELEPELRNIMESLGVDIPGP